MNLLTIFTSWKAGNAIWNIIGPFVLNLIKKRVPLSVTKLYENVAKFTQPLVDSLFRLKEKVRKTPNALDDYCFNQGVSSLETFAHYLLGVVEKLRT